MTRAQECINQVIDMITTQGVAAAKEFATNTVIVIEENGVPHTTTILQLMRNNAEKRANEVTNYFKDKEIVIDV